MSEKRYFKVEYGEEWYLFDSTTISEQLVKEQAEYGYGVFANSLSPSEIVGLLNEQEQKLQKLESENEDLREVNKENQRLHEENVKQCERWKTLYEIKDKEVTARVKRLNEICNRYKYAITFDKDIDPNDAVNILCDRILQTEVEM